MVGLSFCLPSFCISEAKISLLNSIKEANENMFNKKNLNLSYQQKCSTSWLQIDILDPYQTLTKEDEHKVQLISNQLK